MRRNTASSAKAVHNIPEPVLFQPNQALHYCGFICPSCGYQHRLSDNTNGGPIIDLFRADNAHSLTCPECGALTSYERKDLKLLRNGID